MSTEKRAALYVRVSTDHQTVENQIAELSTIAERRGWQIVATYQDAGISGAKGRDQRPGLDQMLKDAKRRKFDVIMAFAIDRLGRSLHDLLGTVKSLEDYGCDIFVDKQELDTTTPTGKLMFQICGAFAEFERGLIKQRVRAGIRRAREKGTKSGRDFGRPATDKATVAKITAAIEAGDKSLRAIASRFDVSEGTVRNIRDRAEA